MVRKFDEAEQNVIGVLLSGERPEIYDILETEMFTDNELKGLYDAIKSFWKKGGTPDLIFAAEWFRKNGINAEEYLKEIISLSPTGYEAITDAKIIRDRFVKQKVARITSEINLNGNIYDEIDRITAELNSITDTTKGSEDISEQSLDDLFEETRTIKTGFHSIDELTDGFEPGDLIAIGARPSVGKSAFVLQMAVQMVKNGHKVCYYNLEMEKKQVRQRLVSHLAGLPLNMVKHYGKLNDESKAKFNIAVEEIKKLKGFRLSNSMKDISSIRRDIKDKKPDVAIIDYLQLVNVGNRYSGNRYAEVGEISHSLKSIAMEMKIPVVVLVQLNRESAGKEGKEPTMAEIRESGDIEQDASVVILMWDKDTEPPKKRKGVKIEKDRQGALGKFEFNFNGSLMQFEDREFNSAKGDLPFNAD